MKNIVSYFQKTDMSTLICTKVLPFFIALMLTECFFKLGSFTSECLVFTTVFIGFGSLAKYFTQQNYR